jgi:Arc/MetJ family transcription regulator
MKGSHSWRSDNGIQSEGESLMAKLNVSIDEHLREELFKLVPPRRRSQVVNEALRHELLRRKRALAAEALERLRKRSTQLTNSEIVQALRRDRGRVSK